MEEKLPKEIVYQTLWYIRRYWDFLDEYEAILEGSSSGTGGGIRSNDISNPTALKAERLEKVSKEIKIIEEALTVVPADYQKAILLSIIARKPYPKEANIKTYKKWKRRFIYAVAIAKGFAF